MLDRVNVLQPKATRDKTVVENTLSLLLITVRECIDLEL